MIHFWSPIWSPNPLKTLHGIFLASVLSYSYYEVSYCWIGLDLGGSPLLNRRRVTPTAGSNPALSAIPHDLHETFLSIGNFYLIADDEVGFEQGVLKRVYPIHGMS